MAIDLAGGISRALVEVDPTFKAMRVTQRPAEPLSWASIGAQSGLLTGVASGASVFSFRNAAANPIMMRRIGLGFILSTAFTTAQFVDFGVMIARSWTASDSGGTQLVASGAVNGKHRTSLANMTSIDARIGTTAALTAGTRTLDALYNAQTGAWGGGIGQGITPAPNNLVSQDAGDYPIILAQNEGFIISPITAMGSTGVGKLFVNLEFAEVANY